MSSSSTTQDRDEIRRWAEERGGRPSVVRTGRRRGGVLRFEFGHDNLQYLHQDEVGSGGTSRFFKCVANRSRGGGRKSSGGRSGSRSATKSQGTKTANRTTRASGSKAAYGSSSGTTVRKSPARSSGPRKSSSGSSAPVSKGRTKRSDK